MDTIVKSVSTNSISFNPLSGTLDINYTLIDNLNTIHTLSVNGIILNKVTLSFNDKCPSKTINFEYGEIGLE